MTFEEAVREFETTFEEVVEGLFGPISQTGERYIEVCADGMTKEQATANWLEAIKPFLGKKRLFWRIHPEMDQDTHKKDFIFPHSPNPNYLRWKIYSRFIATDLTGY